MTPTVHLDEDARFQLGVISGKLDLVLAHQAAQAAMNDARFAKVEARQDETDERVSALQRDRAWLLGGAAGLSAVVSGIATYLGLR